MAEQESEQPDSKRLTAPQIFDAALENARDELARTSRALAFSGFAGGITMGLTGLAVAAIRATLGTGPSQQFIAQLLYPIGFISVIIGRSQLFTENTLYPVILVLDERNPRHYRDLARLWAVVFVTNVLGAFAFAALAIKTPAISSDIQRQLIELGTHALQQSHAQVFWGGVMGGWLIALVAWVVTASHWTIGQLVMVWLLTFVVGIGHFAHCIATSGEILSGVLSGAAAPGAYFLWLLLATSGNILGGVVIVSLLNYGQVKAA